MRTLKDILTVVLLAVIVFLTCSHSGDILVLKRNLFGVRRGLIQSHQVTMHNYHRLDKLDGGLAPSNGGLGSAINQAAPVAGGLAPAAGLRTRSCMVNVRKQIWKGPISVTQWSGGTGAFVSDNIVLTSKHVVENRLDDRAVKIVTEAGEEYVAVAVLEDTDDDLALVEIVGRSGPYLAIGPSPQLGAELTLIGAPFPVNQNRHLTIAWGRVSREIYEKDFLYDAFAWHGYSGGPAIHAGKLVGVIRAKRTDTCGLGFAVPIYRLDPGLRSRF
jgi:S1-C subfamily serine protease